MTSYTVQDDRLIEYYMKMGPFLTYARHTRSEKHYTLNVRVKNWRLPTDERGQSHVS